MWNVVIALVTIMSISYVISTVQDYRRDFFARGLKELLPKTAQVVREGKKTRIEVENVVPGDIVIVNEGSIIPADIRILKILEPVKVRTKKTFVQSAMFLFHRWIMRN